jgi:hypothetical protein
MLFIKSFRLFKSYSDVFAGSILVRFIGLSNVTFEASIRKKVKNPD